MADPQDSIENGNQAENSGARPGPQAPRALTDGTESSDAKSNSDSAAPIAVFYRQRSSEAPGGASAAIGDDTSSWRSPSIRFALLAASIVLAGVAGSLGGSLIASEVMRRPAAEAAVSKTADTRDVVQALKMQIAELAALKTSLDGANRTAGAQLAKISDRLDALERAQTDPSGKLARVADALDRLEKRVGAAPETTGSIAASQTASAAAAPVPDTSVAGPVLKDWIVQEVHNGRALIESRYGAEFFVASGSVLPGLGTVQAVKRQNGEWVVVTTKGVITSGERDQ
ncbi:MAG TPA: hypothetical protein VMF32_09770 [Xanthobacteraceae bacterium]|nr:hypothetical protein [Xanthobacteraceae bacterium]